MGIIHIGDRRLERLTVASVDVMSGLDICLGDDFYPK